MGGTSFLSRNNDFDVERAVTAIIVSPTLEDAVEALKQQGKTTTVGTLRTWRDNDPLTRQRYEERRKQLVPQLETRFANDLLDSSRRATLVTRLAIDQTRELLNAGEVRNPSRVARDLAQVTAQSIEKRHAIQARPTQIVEHRDVNDIVRQLVAMGVATADEPPDTDPHQLEPA